MINTDECELWARGVNQKDYGRMIVKRNDKWVQVNVHRELYETEYGQLPRHLVVDHLCRTPRCINLKHLEPVTNRENILRGVLRDLKTHCKQGHEFTPKNTYMSKTGHKRICITCNRAWRKANYHKNTYKGKYSKN